MVNKKTTLFSWAGLIASLFSFVFLLSGCGSNDPVLASVEQEEITESETIILMKFLGMDSKNKTEIRAFLKLWTEKKMYEIELKNKYPENWKLIELRAEAFQSDLAKYELEDLVLMSKIDTVVSNEEIESYYEDHSDEFILTDYLVRAFYMKIPKEVDFKKKEIQFKYLLKNNKDLDEINSYAKLYAENYYFNDSAWIYFSELTSDIPLSRFNKDNIILNRTKTYFTEGDFTYFLNILDFQLKDEAPSLDFLKEDIRNIILNQRIQLKKEELGPDLLKELKKKYVIQINS